jgi:hypothetical protein
VKSRGSRFMAIRARGKTVKSGAAPAPPGTKLQRRAPAEDFSRFMAVMASAFDRLSAGKRTYGPFDAASDRRDLRQEAEDELLDAITYCYMALLKLRSEGS